MAGLIFTITDAGRQELVNATNTGTDKVLMAAVGVGRSYFEANESQTELPDEIKQITAIGGAVVSPDTIHVSAKDETQDAYDVYSVGLYTDKGTLFAVYSQATAIMQKTAQTTLLLATDITFQSLDTANITFGDVIFSNPPASETMVGVSRFATGEEMDTGDNDTIAVSAMRAKEQLDKKQIKSTVLTALSALASEKDTFPYFSGGENDEMLLTALTAFARGILGKADADGVLSYLGLGEAAKRDIGSATNQVPDMGFFAASLSTNGWQKLPSGMLIQYVEFISADNGQGAVSLPIAYPNRCIGACAIQTNSPAGGAEYLQTIGGTKTAVSYHSYTLATAGGASLLGGNGYRIVAIGY